MATLGRAATCAVLALTWAAPVAAQRASAREAIRLQVQGFYRDDRDHRWPDVLDHFWVGKISARWTAPTSDPAWVAARPIDRDSACASPNPQTVSASIALIDDRWARVFVTRCAVPAPDDLWMLRVGQEWRIARLIRGS
jgi:hypothetical protein